MIYGNSIFKEEVKDLEELTWFFANAFSFIYFYPDKIALWSL